MLTMISQIITAARKTCNPAWDPVISPVDVFLRDISHLGNSPRHTWTFSWNKFPTWKIPSSNKPWLYWTTLHLRSD